MKQYEALKSCFTKDEPQARFHRLQTVFSDPTSEVYLSFLQSVLPVFNDANKFLREEPLIHVLQQQLYSLVKKVLGKFVKPSVLVEAIQREACIVGS